MNGTATRNPLLALVLAGILGAGLAVSAQAEDPGYDLSVVDDAQDAWVALAPQELEELVGPIALYPDDLLAVVLPAAVYPLQLVEAQRLLQRRDQEPDLEADEDWDDAVVALLNYPEVLDLLNEDLDWTLQLGEAVIRQEEDVLDAIERFRERAYVAGNLRSDGRQVVERRDSVIEVRPVEEKVIYVPYYEPRQVIVYQTVPVYHYYPRPRPVYYHPLAVDLWFGRGGFWGVSTYFRLGWNTRHIHVYHHGHVRHPYYGHAYRYGKYRSWYQRHGIVRHRAFHAPHPRWRPRHGYHRFRWHARHARPQRAAPPRYERRVAPGRQHYQARQEGPRSRNGALREDERRPPRQQFTTRGADRAEARPGQERRNPVTRAGRDRPAARSAPGVRAPRAERTYSTAKRAAVSPSRVIHGRDDDRSRMSVRTRPPRQAEAASGRATYRTERSKRAAVASAPRIRSEQPAQRAAPSRRPPPAASARTGQARSTTPRMAPRKAAPARPAASRATESRRPRQQQR
jgi:hypothetical protein